MGERGAGAGAAEDRSTAVGVVLAGGASRRMGRDKATLPWRGTTLAAHAARTLTDAGLAEVVLADAGRVVVPGLVSLPDAAGAGPAAGLLAAAAARPGRTLAVLACDLPAVTPALLRALLALPGDLALPRRDGRPEPLCAVWRPAALAALRANVAAGVVAPRAVVATPALCVAWLEGDALAALGDPTALLRNVNDERELADARRAARGDELP